MATQTLQFALTLSVKETVAGADSNYIAPVISEDIIVDQDPGFYRVNLAAGASAVSILPPNWAEGDEIAIVPEYLDTAGSLARSIDVNLTVSGPTTDDWNFRTFTAFKLPASVTALTCDNGDTNNAVILKVWHWKRS
jgi:hypothetical protein